MSHDQDMVAIMQRTFGKEKQINTANYWQRGKSKAKESIRNMFAEAIKKEFIKDKY